MVADRHVNADRPGLGVLLLVAVVAWCSVGSAMAMASPHGCPGVEAAGQVCAQPGVPDAPPAALTPVPSPDGRIAEPAAWLPPGSPPLVSGQVVASPAWPRGPPRLLG